MAPGADVVVVAAGASTRMGGVDKLTARIGGRPLLYWTLAAFRASPRIRWITLVSTPQLLRSIRTDPDWNPVVDFLLSGGATRQASAAAGVRHLAAAEPDGRDRTVLVHDGARPLVTTALIDAVVDAVEAHGAALPVVPIVETVKRVADGLVVETVDRTSLAAAQTPQGARRRLLLEAWERFPPDGPDTFTDEAALLEACTIPVHAIPGDPANLKVTLPDDLRRVERSIADRAVGTGYGTDRHPFGPGSGLRLGGVLIAGAPQLAGHSDGDVALHAVADALIGAAGLGDLGRLFPSDARTPAGISSKALVREVVDRLAAAGAAPATIDVVIEGARPKLGTRLDDMREAIAGLTGLDASAVNVKASTGNLAGDDGAGRSISAHAVATVRRQP